MNSLVSVVSVAAFTFLFFSVLPSQFSNVVGLLIMLSVEYLRAASQYLGLISSSEVNYISIAIYMAFIAHCLLTCRESLRKLVSPPLLIVLAFWIGYIFSGALGISVYGVEPKLLILVAFKALALLCAVARLTWPRELYVCILITVGAGAVDLWLGWTDRLQLSATMASRELGFIPWLRMDTIWFAQAILWAYIASREPDRHAHPAIVFWRTMLGLAFIIAMSVIIFYGTVTVQLRALAAESLIGLALVLILRSTARLKILAFALVIALTGFILWGVVDADLRDRASQGLLGRNDGGRLELWSYSIRLWLDSPIIGHGLGTDGVFLAQFALPGREGSHNAYLILAIELGVVGLAAWLYINAKALRLEFAALQAPKWKTQRYQVLVIVILHVTMLFHVMFHGLIYFPWVIMLPAIPCALFNESAVTHSPLAGETLVTGRQNLPVARWGK